MVPGTRQGAQQLQLLLLLLQQQLLAAGRRRGRPMQLRFRVGPGAGGPPDYRWQLHETRPQYGMGRRGGDGRVSKGGFFMYVFG